MIPMRCPTSRAGHASLLASAPMKRFWLLFLVLVMPLQMSWAAVHFCDDRKPYAASTQGTGTAQADLARQASMAVAHAQTHAAGAGVGIEACCGAAHSCHGLHGVMPHEAVAAAAGSLPRILPAFQPRLVPGADPPRHERPQWPAA